MNLTEHNASDLNIVDKKENFISKLFSNKKNSRKENKNRSKDLALDTRFRSIFELAPDGILVLDLTGKVLLVNKAYTTLTGYPEEEVVGRHITQLQASQVQDLPQYLKVFTAIIAGKEAKPLIFRYVRSDGTLGWGEARATLIKTGLISGEVVAILRDTTETKEHEEELTRINLELERSNKELDDYTYAVSHDLKAPLRTIESFSSFLLEDHSDNLDNEGKEYLQRIQSATKRMNTLIQDLLLISRVGRLNTEIDLVDLNEVIGEIKYDMETTLNEKNGKIIYIKLPSIKTQKVWIKQVFSNLISNGLKFNESPNPKIWIKCEENKDQYIFSVKDNGIGIDEKHHDKIFRIFQRLHTVNEYPGTGAGLTMCKKIVESMGGNISLDSKPGKGSTFYITLPKGSEISEESEPPYQSDDSLSLVHENTNIEH
jgi:PAS domain S-box-containing protein